MSLESFASLRSFFICRDGVSLEGTVTVLAVFVLRSGNAFRFTPLEPAGSGGFDGPGAVSINCFNFFDVSKTFESGETVIGAFLQAVGEFLPIVGFLLTGELMRFLGTVLNCCFFGELDLSSSGIG